MTNINRDLHLSHGCFGWLEAGDASLYPSNDSVHDNNGGWNQVGSRNKGKKRQTGSEFQNSKMQKMSKQNAHVRRVFVGVAPQEQPTTFAENVAQEPKEARTNLPKKTKRYGKFKKTGNQNATMSKKLQNELFEKEKAEFDLILRGFEATHDRVAHDCSTMFQQVSEFSKTSKKVLENLEATRRFHSRIFDFEVASLPDAWRENGKKVFSDSIRQHSSNGDEFIPSAKEDFFYPVLERLGAATGNS